MQFRAAEGYKCVKSPPSSWEGGLVTGVEVMEDQAKEEGWKRLKSAQTEEEKKP